MVFQNYALYPHKTVYKNLAFPLQMRKLPRDEIEAKVRAAAKVLDIEHLLERRPRELSGGQQQRVALGRALVRDPRAFLMDEPLSNLDAKLRVQMRSELKRFHQDLNATVIYVTHDQLEAVTMADKMAVMNGGFLQQYDAPDAGLRPSGEHLRRELRRQPGDEPHSGGGRRQREARCRCRARRLEPPAARRQNARKALARTTGEVVLGARHSTIKLHHERGARTPSRPRLHGRADRRHHLRPRPARLVDRRSSASPPQCRSRPTTGLDRVRPGQGCTCSTAQTEQALAD